MIRTSAARPERRTRVSQVTYGSGSLQLSLALRSRAMGPALEVDGTLVDRFSGEVSETPAYLLRGGRILAQAETDARGAFHMRTPVKEGLRICLFLQDDRIVELELGHYRHGREENWAVRPTSRSC